MMICNWATVVDFECLREDNGFSAVAELAFPAGVLIHDKTKIDAVKAMVVKEINDTDDSDDDKLPSVLTWKWVPNTGCLTFNLSEGRELIAVLICRNIDFMED